MGDKMKKIIVLIVISLCFTSLSGCEFLNGLVGGYDWTKYPDPGHYLSEKPYFELYYNVDHDTPGNSKIEYNGEIVNVDFMILGNTGSIDLLNSDGSSEMCYFVKWKLTLGGNIVVDRYTKKLISSNPYKFEETYYDTITLVRQSQ